MTKSAPKLDTVDDTTTEIDNAPSIAKPTSSRLDKFKTKLQHVSGVVDPFTGNLQVHKPAAVKDYIRTHHDEGAYWSDELCFVNVPIKGQPRETTHIIEVEIALAYLPKAKLRYARLALATTPYDNFFLAEIATRNLDNDWCATERNAAQQLKGMWGLVFSGRDQGVEKYLVKPAEHQDAFPAPRWPTSVTIDDIILRTFADRMIETEEHPGLLRLRGARQNLS